MNPSSKPLAIAHIGDFSVSNWGDQLYPRVISSLLDMVGIRSQPSLFAPLPGSTVDGRAIRTLSDVRASGADAALIGGGDLIRFDTRTVAMDHMSMPTGQRGSRVSRLRARWYATRQFLPGPGVWVPEQNWLDGRPSVLISVGVHTVPETAAANAAVTRYTAAWVRTHNGAERLAGAGMPSDRIVVAPDAVFALPEYEDIDATRARGEAIFRDQLGLEEPPMLFQAAQFHGWPPERVSAALASLKGIPTATLALGAYSGEDRILATEAQRNGIGSLSGLDEAEITAVLAAAGCVFTTSMHAAIAAASFGTAVIVPGIAKTEHAFEVCPRPPTLHAADDASLRETATALLGRRQPHDTEENRAAVVQAFTTTLKVAELI